jgi:hypothetical protein
MHAVDSPATAPVRIQSPDFTISAHAFAEMVLFLIFC